MTCNNKHTSWHLENTLSDWARDISDCHGLLRWDICISRFWNKSVQFYVYVMNTNCNKFIGNYGYYNSQFTFFMYESIKPTPETWTVSKSAGHDTYYEFRQYLLNVSQGERVLTFFLSRWKNPLDFRLLGDCAGSIVTLLYIY